MKKHIFLIAITLIQLPLFSQELMSKYKTGTVKLVPDTEFARGNDWNNVFSSFYDTINNNLLGMHKTLVILPDGSLIVNHANSAERTVFTPAGIFEKEFTVEKAGNGFILGVINSNTLFTCPDNMGKMICSDLNGKYKKTLNLNYSTEDIIALSNGKFAVVGRAIWTNKYRTFISLIDYETNKEKVIWEHFDGDLSHDENKLINREPFNYLIKLKEGGIVGCTTMPFSKQGLKGLPPRITTVNNELIVAIPNTGEILVYDLDGNLKSKSVINWKPGTISVDEQKAIQQKAIDKYNAYIESGDKRVQNNLEAYKTMISEMEDDLRNITKPVAKPSFSNIIRDSDGNVLFFEIPEEKDANIFHVWVYNQVGRFATKCTFICDDYDLNINSGKMVFKDGYIYGIQNLKKAEGIPLRLVRFALKAD